MSKNLFVKVAVPIAVFDEFLYSVPENLVDKVEIGKRALVPFRKSGYTGIITEVLEIDDEIINYSVKDIEEIPDNFKIFSKQEINIAKRLSDYYVSPLGITLYSFIPSGLKWKKVNGKWEKFEYESKLYKVLKENLLTEKLTEKQLKLINFIESLEFPLEEEILEAGFSKRTLDSLVKKDVLKVKYVDMEENNISNISKKNIKNIEPVNLENSLYFFSGKNTSERFKFYINLLGYYLSKNKSVILVFPNIKSITHFYKEISKHIPDTFIYFEGIKQKKLIETIKKLQKKSGILITTYSGMLIPVKNLGIVIVEEEYANSYKTKKTPKMDIRRIAYEIHKEKNIPAIYSGYIPSIESYYMYTKKQIKPLEKNFLTITENTKIKIYPYDKEKVFSHLIKNLITEDTLILANKKAYASFLYCSRCDEEIVCNNCDVPLKIYKKENLFLKCEICKEKYEFINTCPNCENHLLEVGTGIEKIEEILKFQFGENFISRLEENKKTPVKITTTITNLEFLPQSFKTIINVFPDFSLFTPDYQGRYNFFKNVVIPFSKARENYYLITNQSEDIAVKSFLSKNLKLFYEFELKTRKVSKMPPFSKLILLTFEKKNLNLEFLQNLFEIWIKANNIQNFDYKGVLKGYIQKRKNKNVAQVLLVNFKEKELLKDLYEKAQKLGLKMSINLNPVSIIY